jgi:hypothetical protein
MLGQLNKNQCSMIRSSLTFGSMKEGLKNSLTSSQ